MIDCQKKFEELLELQERMPQSMGFEGIAGVITLTDGRKAQVTVKLQLDEDEWIDSDQYEVYL